MKWSESRPIEQFYEQEVPKKSVIGSRKWPFFANARLNIDPKMDSPRLKATWEVGHTQYVTSRATRNRFQRGKVRLIGL